MSIYLGNTEIGDIYLGNTKIAEAYLGSTKVYSVTPPVPAFDGWIYKDGVWLNGCTPLTKKGKTVNNLITQDTDKLTCTTAQELWIETPLLVESGKKYDAYVKMTYCPSSATNYYTKILAYDADDYTSLMVYGDNSYTCGTCKKIHDEIEANGYHIGTFGRSNLSQNVNATGKAGHQICLYLLNFYGERHYTEIKLIIS